MIAGADMARLLLIALVLAGCAPGYVIGPLPVVSEPERAATVVFVRVLQFAAAGATLTITIDGVETYELGTGEHIVVRVPAGEHLVGVKGGWDLIVARIHPTHVLQAESGRTYYFRIDPVPAGINRTTEAEGRELVAKTKPAASEATGPRTP